jgi:hypothetical protein
VNCSEIAALTCRQGPQNITSSHERLTVNRKEAGRATHLDCHVCQPRHAFRWRYIGSSPFPSLAAPSAAQPHIRSPLGCGGTKIPHARGLGLGNGTTLYDGISQPERYQVRSPISAGATASASAIFTQPGRGALRAELSSYTRFPRQQCTQYLLCPMVHRSQAEFLQAPLPPPGPPA